MSQVLESPLDGGRAAAARHAWSEAFDLLNEADKSGLLTADDLHLLAEAAWWRGKLDESIVARERAERRGQLPAGRRHDLGGAPGIKPAFGHAL